MQASTSRRSPSARHSMHLLSAALLAALALSACQAPGDVNSSTSKNEQVGKVGGAQAAQADAPRDKLQAADAAAAASAGYIAPAEPAKSIPAQPLTESEAKSAGNLAPAGLAQAQVDQVMVTGSRVREDSRLVRRMAAAPMPVASPAMIAPPPPPPYYSQPANTEKYAEREDNPVVRAS
ncbi:hypothetical protein AB4084_04875, partial [Lysobacter sp. 2RAB21]